MFLALLLLFTLYNLSSSQEKFVIVDSIASDAVPNVIYQGIGLPLVCPTVEPSSIYLYEGGVNENGDGQFEYRHLDGAFTLNHVREPCRCRSRPSCPVDLDQTCDQLVMQHVPGQPQMGLFQVRYTAPSLQIPLLVNIDYGPPNVNYLGSLPIRVNSSSTFARFLYRSPRDEVSGSRFAACETSSGNSSRIFVSFVVLPNTTCATVGPIVRNELNTLSLLVDVESNTMDRNEMVHVVEGTCPGTGNVVSPPYSVQYEVTGTMQPVTTPSVATPTPTTFTPITVMTPFIMKGSTPSLGILLGVIITLVAVGACIVCIIIGFCLWRYNKKRKSSPINDTDPSHTANGELTSIGVTSGSGNGHVKSSDTQTDEPDLLVVETKIDDYDVNVNAEKEEAVDTTVNRIAFVMPDSSNVFQELSSILLECHGCERAHPVATYNNGTSDPSASLNLQVCNWLKGDCLVYVMWEGSLEELDDKSEVKRIVRQFSHRKMLDPHAGAGVMHRLVLLQLGSSGKVQTRVSSNGSLWVFQRYSSTDGNFDPNRCAREVCDIVRDRFLELDRRKTSEDQLTTAMPLLTPHDPPPRPYQSGPEGPRAPRSSEGPQPPHSSADLVPNGSQGPRPRQGGTEGPQPPETDSEGPRHPSNDSDKPIPPKVYSVGPKLPKNDSDGPQFPQGGTEDPQPLHGDNKIPKERLPDLIKYIDVKFENLEKSLGGKIDKKGDEVLDAISEDDLAEEQDMGETEAERIEVMTINNFNISNTDVKSKVDKTLVKK